MGALHSLFIYFLVIPFLLHAKDKPWDMFPTCKLTLIQLNPGKILSQSSQLLAGKNRSRMQRANLKPRQLLSEHFHIHYCLKNIFFHHNLLKIIIPILQIRKRRHGKVKCNFSLRALKWKAQVSPSGN